MAIKETCRLYTLCAGMYVSEVKYCDDTQPEQQLARATVQHTRLKYALAQQFHEVSLCTILIGVMGTIYKCHAELPLNKFGLDRCRLRKLTLDLNTHSIQYATKITNTSRRLKNIKERTCGTFQNPPNHTYDLLPSLMVEVCLVLAPVVNFILNSRKQGLPCRRSLFFSFYRGSERATSRFCLKEGD